MPAGAMSRWLGRGAEEEPHDRARRGRAGEFRLIASSRPAPVRRRGQRGPASAWLPERFSPAEAESEAVAVGIVGDWALSIWPLS